MSSARGTLRPSKKPSPYKRQGKPSKAEKALVAEFVSDQKTEITPAQTTALAKVLRRSKDVTKSLIEDAKDALIDNTKRYVTIHMQATEAALEDGSPKALDVATKAAQWALENIGESGTKVVEAATKADAGPRVLVGIRIGGMNAPVVVEND